jgi:hypothetical protein
VRVESQPLRWFSEGPAPTSLLSIDTGAGDDTVHATVLDNVIEVFERSHSAAIAIDSGSGDDNVFVQTRDVADLQIDLLTGDGNDTVVTRSNVTAVWLTVGFFEVTSDVKTGAGDDKVSIHNEGVTEDFTRVDTGEGNDSVEFDSRAGVGILKSMDGGRSFIENLGTVTFTFTLGFGDDRAQINTIGYGEVNGVVDAGDGDDTIESSSSLSPNGRRFKPLFAFHVEELDNPTRLNLEVLLGAGDDHLEIDSASAGLADIRIVGGDGDDEIRTRHRMFAVVDRTKLNLVILLGAGDDTVVMETAGYRRVQTAINTGPAGDGSDSVSASHQSQRRSSRKHNVRMNLDGGRDVYRHTSKGYAVQKTVQSAVSVEWVFTS